MAKNRFKTQSIDETAGTIIFVSADDENPIEDGKRMRTIINGGYYSGTFNDGQCWIFTRKPLGSTYSIKHS